MDRWQIDMHRETHTQSWKREGYVGEAERAKIDRSGMASAKPQGNNGKGKRTHTTSQREKAAQDELKLVQRRHARARGEGCSSRHVSTATWVSGA